MVAVWAACRIPTTSGSLLPGSPKYDLGGVVAGRGVNHTYREKRYLVSNRCRLLIFPKLPSTYCWLNTFPRPCRRTVGAS